MKPETIRRSLLAASLAFVTGIALVGCQGDPAVQAAGAAIVQGLDTMEENYEFALRVRSADPNITVGEALSVRGVSSITEAEANLMRHTFTETRETAIDLSTYGSN